MLAAKRLPEILRSVLTDGVEGAVVMTSDGSVLASEFIASLLNPHVNETSLAAISSSVWSTYSQVIQNDLTAHIMKFEKGFLAVGTAGKGYLVAVYGCDTKVGLLRGRLDALSQYFMRIFEQLKS